MVDVFPRRNLPPQAEQWGREVENRVTSLETETGVNAQGLAGQNRNIASSLSLIAQQIEDLRATQATIPITRSLADRQIGFSVPSTYPTWTEISRIDILNPSGRRAINLFCVANMGIYENTPTPTAFSQTRMRIYNLETGAYMGDSGDQPAVRSPQVTSTFHSATALYAEEFTTPEGGIFITQEVTSTVPANFPADARNFTQLVVQTSFL